MSAECCGKLVETPYCPWCGEEIDGGTLWGLLKHCRDHARLAHVRANEGRSVAERTSGQGGAKQWEAWADQLEALLNPTLDLKPGK